MFENQEAIKSVIQKHTSEEYFISERNKPTNYEKYIIFDFDDVFNMYATESPIKNYLSNLTDGRLNYLRESKKKIFDSIFSLEKGEDPVSHGKIISKYFREGGLSERIHLDLCEKASDDFVPAKNLKKTIDILNSMKYNQYILSASPEELIVFSKNKNEIKISDDNVYSTNFSFGDGKFISMNINLGNIRRSNRDTIVNEKKNTKAKLEIMVDDNPETGKRILRPGNYVNFWLNRKSPENDNFNIADYTIREDFSNLVERLKKIDRGFDIVNSLDETRYSNSIKCVVSGISYAKNALKSDGKEFVENKNQSMLMLKAYDVKMGNMSFYDRKLREKISQVYAEDDKIKSNGKIKEIIEKIDGKCLETKLDVNLLEKYLPVA